MTRFVPLWILLAMALLLRVVCGVGVQWVLDRNPERDFLIAGDAEGYWLLGHAIARGDDYAVHEPPRYVLRMPGYPLFLAGSQLLFGESHFAARMLQVVVGTVNCGLVYWLGRRMIGHEAAMWGCGLMAVHPLAVGMSVLLLSETLFATGLLLSLLAVTFLVSSEVRSGGFSASAHPPPDGGALPPKERSKVAVRRLLFESAPATRRLILLGLVTGVAIGFATYMHPSWLLAGPIFAAGLMVHSWWREGIGGLTRSIVPVIAIQLALFLTLLPWGLRNQRVTGHFVLTTLWMGPSLYDGLNPEADGTSDMTFFDADGLANQLTEFEVDQHYRQKSWDFVKDQPGKTLWLAGMKQLKYWSPWPTALELRNPWLVFPLGGFGVLVYVTAIVGIWRLLGDLWTVGLLVMPIFYFGGLHAIFVGSIRYRLPAEYALAVVCGVGCQWIWRKFNESSVGKLR